MKRYLMGLLLVVSTQINAETVYSDKTPPGKWTHQEMKPTALLTSFDGGNGKISSDLGANTVVKGMVVDKNGDIYVCGSHGSTAHAMVARYKKTSNGVHALDTSFDGTNGYVKFATEAASVANAIALDGESIYVVGSGTVSSAGKLIAKLKKSDGSLDTTFSTDGIYLSTALGTSAVGHGIVVDDKHVYAVGTDGTDATVIKVTKSAGVADTVFDGDSGTGGSNGELTVDVSGSTDIAYDVVVDGTTLYIVGDGGSDYFVVKMDAPTGKLHTAANGFTAFATNGIAYTSGDSNAVAKSVVLDKDFLYVAGNNASTSAVIQKYNKLTGGLKDDFGTSGRWESATVGALNSVKLLNRKLYVAGVKSSKMSVARLNTTGTSPLDTSFFTNGYDVALGDNATLGAVALDFLKEPHLPIILAGYDASSGNFIELTVYENDVDILSAARVAGLSAGHLSGGLTHS